MDVSIKTPPKTPPKIERSFILKKQPLIKAKVEESPVHMVARQQNLPDTFLKMKLMEFNENELGSSPDNNAAYSEEDEN